VRFGAPPRPPMSPMWFREGELEVAHLVRYRHFGIALRLTQPAEAQGSAPSQVLRA